MSKEKMTLLAAAWALLNVGAAHAQERPRLAFLIPTLYGPEGLKVDSAARLPSGETHSAHFNSAFQAEFTQFNIALASQLAAVPLPSPASGFTYSMDPGLGVWKRSTQSFGPIFAERAETIGRGKLSMGFNYQSFAFDTLEGLSLDALPAVFTHDNPAPGGRADVVATTNSIDVAVQRFTALFTYGVADRLDLSVAVPLVGVDLTVASDARIDRIGTSASPATHFYDDPEAPGGFGSQRRFSRSGSASGIGDVLARLKGTVLKAGHAGLALGADVRFPTGDEEDLLGSGAWGAKPFLALSFAWGKAAPHLNLGYEWNGKSVLAGDVVTGEKKRLPDQILYAAGVDVGLDEKLTVAFDVVGRRVIDSPRLRSRTFTALDGRTTLPDIHFVRGSFNVTDAAVGLKFNLVGKLLLDMNVLVNLDRAGLRDRVTPLFGLEYSR